MTVALSSSPEKVVEIENWNPAGHRSDPDRDIVSISVRFIEKKLIINGLPCYTSRTEGRGTVLSQGLAKDCLDLDYHYKDGLETDVNSFFPHVLRPLLILMAGLGQAVAT